MIRIAAGTNIKAGVLFFTREAAKKLHDGEGGIFQGEYLQTFPRVCPGGVQECCVGIGEEKLTGRMLMEAAACGAAFWHRHKVRKFYVDLSGLEGKLTGENLAHFVQGLYLGGYEQPQFPVKKSGDVDIVLLGLDVKKEGDAVLEEQLKSVAKGGEAPFWAQSVLEQGTHVAEGIAFARDMVNYPGNLLRPYDFAEAIRKQMAGLDIEVEVLQQEQLEKMGMGGLLTVGMGSGFSPCMAILRYTKNPGGECLALVGKGVTCDTGGYCLKPSGSMAGIRGDMAGGAAVAGCLYALAKNQVRVNVTGVIPICENRISPDSYLPGDVITMYDRKSVEICNTDAEGRLILGDAVAYAVEKEGASQVIDIATLTGAVVNLFGFTIGGVLCDDDRLYREFEAAAEKSGEQYARIPYYPEHEEMLKSEVADLKNLGPDYCGTITAGLFIRRFVKGRPWLHMDIAGTAWVDTPVWKFQKKGATGAGVATLYELCRKIQK